MSEEPFVLELGGRRWELPHLPFRVIKAIQPMLFKVYAQANQGEALSEAQIDDLARAVWRAASHVDAALAYEEFMDLPFSLADLFGALPAVAQASGLRPQSATAEASPGSVKSHSTT